MHDYIVGDKVIITMSSEGHSPRRINGCHVVVGQEYWVVKISVAGVHVSEEENGESIYNGFVTLENFKRVKKAEIVHSYKTSGIVRGHKHVD